MATSRSGVATPSRTTTSQPPLVQGRVVPETAPETYNEKLNRLLGQATELETDLSQDRPQVQLDEEGVETFRQWADAKFVNNVYGDYTKDKGDELKKLCLKAWVGAVWQYKTKPANMDLIAESENGGIEVETVFVVKEFKVVLPKSPNSIRSTAIKELVKGFQRCGLTDHECEEMAEKIVTECFSFQPTLVIRDLDDLIEPQEVDAKTKLMDLLLWDGQGTPPAPLNETDRRLLFQKKMVPGTQPGFLDRVCRIVKSRDQLDAVFQIAQPEMTLSAPKYSRMTQESDRFKRLVENSRRIIEQQVTSAE